MTGLILGRFFPPHAGHLYLIHQALVDCDRVYVVICSQAAETIPGKYRYEWLRLIYHYECTTGHMVVIHITEEIPSASRDNPHAPRIWAQKIQEHVSIAVDRVYTSEHYGMDFAASLSANLVNVDSQRMQIPVSATKIRETPLEYWRYIPVFVRPYFIHRLWKDFSPADKKLITTVVPVQSRLCAKRTADELARRFHAPVSDQLLFPHPCPLLFSLVPAAELLSMDSLQQQGMLPPLLQVEEPLAQKATSEPKGKNQEVQWYLQRLENFYGITPD